MISLVKVIEERLQGEELSRAKPVKAESDNYIQGRIVALKQAFASGRIPANEYHTQLRDLIKNRLVNRNMGVTQF
jgi:hypothetical protein